MSSERTWEEETLWLLGEAEGDLRRAQQRLASAQRAVEAQERRIASIKETLSLYREKYGVEQPPEPVLSEDEIVRYRNLSLREMLLLWADTHDGTLVMNDISQALAAAGLFRDKQRASGALYSTAQRHGDFERVGRGVFQRVTVQPGEVAQNGHAAYGDDAAWTDEPDEPVSDDPPAFTDPDENMPSLEDEQAHAEYLAAQQEVEELAALEARTASSSSDESQFDNIFF